MASGFMHRLRCQVLAVVLGCLLIVQQQQRVSSTEQAKTLRYRVMEEQDPGTFVGNVRVDAGVDDTYDRFVVDQVRFRLMTQPEWTFILEESSGIIRTGDRIDRDRTCPQKPKCSISLDVVVMISDNNEGDRFVEIIKVWVEILDKNDNQPYFSQVQIQKQILESALPGTGIVIPTAIDPDSGINGIQRYELISSDRMFRLDVEEKLDGSTKVLLVLQGRLDREDQDFYEMKVVANDGGDPPKSGSVEIFVSVQDANDNSPVFSNQTYEFTIYENVAVGTVIGRIHATDRDAGANGQIVYSLSSQTQAIHGRTFSIQNNTGEIIVRGEVDYEEHPIYTLSVTARDKGADALPVDATVIIRVLDINDHPPVIRVNTLAAIGVDQAEVEEDADVDTFVAHITVTDVDVGRNGKFNCTLNDNHFQLDKLYESEYKIVTRALLDREIRSQYNLAIKCEDFGEEPQVAIKHIRVIVVDINDNSPIFTKDVYTSSLIENNYMGVFVTQVNATDRDDGRNSDIRYSLDRDAGDYFEVDQYSGSISARAVFDREQTQQLSFHVIASDRGQPRKKSRAQVIVTINDVNDERPEFSTTSYSFGVYENEPGGTEVGFVHAVDADSTPYKSFEFMFAPDREVMSKFEINPYTGRIITKVELDREEKAVYYLVVVAKDGGTPPMSSTATVSIYVADKNDNPPVFDFPSETNNTIHISNKSPLGYIITKVQAYDRDYGSNGNLTYSIVAGNEEGAFRMDPTTGTIAVHKELKEINFYLYELTIQVADNGPNVQSVTTNLNIMVNKSIAFPLAEAHILTGHNFTIVITLACGSGVVVVILIIAIICIRRQDLERRHHKYNCRMEALKMLHSREVPKDSDDSCSGKGVGMHNSNCSSGDEKDKPKKEVSFNLECDDKEYGTPEKSHRSWPSTIDHRTLEHPQACSSMLNHTLSSPPPPPPPPGSQRMTPSPGGCGLPADHAHYQLPPAPPPPSGHSQPTNGNAGQAWALTQRELEVHQLLQMLKQDADAESAYSGEGSNTDSGRGPSEEGEGPRPHPDPNTSGVSPYGATGARACPEEDSFAGHNNTHNNTSAAQVVPNVPGHSFTSSNYSYSSQPPTQMRTFAPSTVSSSGLNYSDSTSPSNDFLKKKLDVNNAQQQHHQQQHTQHHHPLRIEDARGPEADPKKSVMPPPPPPPASCPIDATQLDLETPRSQIGANYIRKYYKATGADIDRAVAKLGQPQNAHNHSGHDSQMEEMDISCSVYDDDGGSVQYSCADMSAALRLNNTTLQQQAEPGFTPNNALHPLDAAATNGDDADSTTTTSGSYVVDPQDLVNEIDDLFFRDMMV